MLKNTEAIICFILFKNTEAIICFILFTHQFSDRSYGSYTYSRPILIKLNSKFRIPSVGGYMLKNTDFIRNSELIKKCYF